MAGAWEGAAPRAGGACRIIGVDASQARAIKETARVDASKAQTLQAPQAPAADAAALSLAEYGDALRRRTVGAKATVQRLLDTIEQANRSLDAFTYVDAERALAAAAGIDALVLSKVDLGPLMGVPIALKDLYAVDGM